MNASTMPVSMAFLNNSLTENWESWFVPVDILLIICLVLVVVLGGILLLIIIVDKTCHTVPMMLASNSFLSVILFAGDILWMTIFALRNDLGHLFHQDSACALRGYLSYVFCSSMNYSFFLQSIYRYLSVLYPSRLFWRSVRMQLYLVCLSWLYALIHPLAFLVSGRILYNAANQICQIPLGLSLSLFFMVSNVYLIPVMAIQLIYIRLVRYVKEMRQRVTTGNSCLRAQKELKMVRQIVVIITILVVLGLPYTSFIFMSFVTSPPKYCLRIASIFIDTSLMFVVIGLLQFTEPLKSSVTRRLHLHPATTVPANMHT